MPFPSLMAWATIAVELLGGLLILLGAFVTLASIPEPVLTSGSPDTRPTFSILLP
jgi:uncharacterized membrane protein YphA (DoxX/SURF4 family)